MKTPVLFLLFNRPDLAERVFSRIREARPDQLYIAVDGPRPEREGEGALVEANRRFAERVDWPCEVHTLFREENLGCGPAVSSAISWFFDHVEAGIILEDDCLPDPTFFDFAGELLEWYAEEEEIMMINGSSIMSHEQASDRSYYFSMFDRIWGWASWRRAWQHYRFELPAEASGSLVENLKSLNLLSRLFLKQRYSLVRSGKIETWDYQWEHAMWSEGGLAVTPFGNLISNIGFDGRGTHTVEDTQSQGLRELSPLEFPLKHPSVISRDVNLDREYEKSEVMSSAILLKGVLRRLRRLLNQ